MAVTQSVCPTRQPRYFRVSDIVATVYWICDQVSGLEQERKTCWIGLVLMAGELEFALEPSGGHCVEKGAAASVCKREMLGMQP